MTTQPTPETVAVAEFLALLGTSKIPKFVAVKGYETKEGKISNYVVNVNAKYSKKVAKDIATLRAYLASFDAETGSALHYEAACKLLAGLERNSSPETASAGSLAQAAAYTHVNGAIKRHNATGVFYLFAYCVSRTVLVPAPAKADTRRPLTKAQDELKKTLKLKTAQYVSFTVRYGDTFTLAGRTLTVVPAPKQVAVLA